MRPEVRLEAIKCRYDEILQERKKGLRRRYGHDAVVPIRKTLERRLEIILTVSVVDLSVHAEELERKRVDFAPARMRAHSSIDTLVDPRYMRLFRVIVPVR